MNLVIPDSVTLRNNIENTRKKRGKRSEMKRGYVLHKNCRKGVARG
jgi:hypothetical protein